METTSFRPPPALIREHMTIVHRVVAQVGRRLPRSVPREDLLAAGTIGLYQALKKGPPEHPAMFAAYASLRVRGAVFDELRRLDWFPRRRPGAAANPSAEPAEGASEATDAARATEQVAAPRSARTLVAIDDLEVTSPLAASNGTPGEHVEDKESLVALRGAVADLPKREREVIELRYFHGISGKEAATALGVSEARVSQLHSQAIERLRRRVAGGDSFLLAA